MSKVRLIAKIIELSESNEWELAKLEWELEDIYEDDPSTCICGHYPIVEHCVLRNSVNWDRAIVGNCCVKRFMGLPSNKIFDGIKRVRNDPTKALNEAAIYFAANRKWLSDWEKEFCMDTKSKRVLSPRQMFTRKNINQKVLEKFAQKPG